MRLIKILLVLFVVLAIGIVAYAYLGDMGSVQHEIRVPISTGGSGGS